MVGNLLEVGVEQVADSPADLQEEPQSPVVEGAAAVDSDQNDTD